MTWTLTYLLPITIGVLFVALLLLGAISYASKRWESHPLNAVYGQVAASIVIAAVVGPTFTHMWAMKRDLEQRAWDARVAHFERLRPILLNEAKEFKTYSDRVNAQGHLIGSLRGTDVQKNVELMWNRDFLIADLGSHFAEYASRREKLRSASIYHDAKLRELVDRIGSGFSIPADVGNDERSVRQNGGMALVHRCVQNGYGMRMERPQSGGYSYSYSAGGSASSSSGDPSPAILSTWEAFQNFKPDASFNSVCSELRAGVDDLSADFIRLANEALVLAEVATLQGDCDYLR